MEAVSLNTLFKISFLFFLIISFTNAQIAIKQMSGHSETSVISLRPYIEIINEGNSAVELAELIIDYYIFEENLSASDLSWEYYTGLPEDNIFTLSFFDLDEVYEENDKKANIKCEISFNTPYLLAPGASYKMQYGIHKSGWNYTFDQSDDWSFLPNTNYSYNDRIVVKNYSSETVLYGIDIEAGNGNSRPYAIPANWLGSHILSDFDGITIKEGDSYYNSSDKKSYIYYNGSWTLLADVEENESRSIGNNKLNVADGNGNWRDSDLFLTGGVGAVYSNIISNGNMALFSGISGSKNLDLVGTRITVGGGFEGTPKIVIDQNPDKAYIQYYSIDQIEAAGNKSIVTKEYVDSKSLYGKNSGDMIYWNGTQWIEIPANDDGDVLKMKNGRPQWSKEEVLDDGKIEDIDGNIYNTVKIGNQVWTVENLRTTRYNDGTPISFLEDDVEWQYNNTGAYCYYNNVYYNRTCYGALYNWHAVNTGKLAPEGWHVPTEADWNKLENYLIEHHYNLVEPIPEINVNGLAQCLASKSGWAPYGDPSARNIGSSPQFNNRTGFTALPGGYRDANGSFTSAEYNSAHWWSATQRDESYANHRKLLYYQKSLRRTYVTVNGDIMNLARKEKGHYIRLVKN